jgi:MYXO-CTERM domain-containing protein
LRAVVEQTEFDGKPIGLVALGNEEIDAACVVVEASAVVGGQMVVETLGGEANLKDALRFVVPNERGAHDFSQLAVGAAARAVHLPEAVLSGDVALGNEEIVERGGVDVGHAVGVAADDNRGRYYGSGKAREVDVAVKLGQRGYGGRAKPQDAGQGGEEKQHQEAAAGPEKEQGPVGLGPAAFAAAVVRRRRRLQWACWR